MRIEHHALLRRTAAVSLLGLLAACTTGGAPPAGDDAAVTEMDVGLVDFEINRSSTTLSAAPVILHVTNAGGTAHDLRVVHDGEVIASTRVLAPGENETIEVDLSGLSEVTFTCVVDGHDHMGMTVDVPVEGSASASSVLSSREVPVA